MAKRFQFRLQKILELRQWHEKQAQNKLAAKTGECATLERDIQQLMVSVKETFLKRAQAGSDWSVLRSYDLFKMRLEKEIATKEKLLAQKLVEREELLKLFIEAQKKRKVLETLAEKKALQFKKDAEKRQSLRQDDLNSAAYIRKMQPTEADLG